MTKAEFFAAIDNGDMVFPETDEQIEWWDEWYELHPVEKAKTEKSYADLNEKQANEYMCLKIFARTFIEENGTGLYFAEVFRRKIVITKKLGKLFKNAPKLEIKL